MIINGRHSHHVEVGAIEMRSERTVLAPRLCEAVTSGAYQPCVRTEAVSVSLHAASCIRPHSWLFVDATTILQNSLR